MAKKLADKVIRISAKQEKKLKKMKEKPGPVVKDGKKESKKHKMRPVFKGSGATEREFLAVDKAK